MKTHQKLKLATIILLQLPAVLWSLWSFKMHKDLFSGTKGKQIETHFSGNKFLEHTGSGLLTTGVCPLGKVGAWFILIWSIILIYLLYYYYNKYTSLKDINRVNKIFCTMNSFFIGIIFILTLIMNRPLFIRTLPFFYTQIAISIIILNSCSS